KGESGWGANRIADKDPRLTLGDRKMPLSARNANTMWMLHFLAHLKDGGTAGFVMATGELSNGETARLEVRQALVDLDYVDCIVQLTNQLFANTAIPCSLWFLSKNRSGGNGYRKRTGEVLYIDARRLGKLIQDFRRQKELSGEDIAAMSTVYRTFRTGIGNVESPGFAAVGTLEEIRQHGYSLTPGRYVGTADDSDLDADFAEVLPGILRQLNEDFDRGAHLVASIRGKLSKVSRAD
ncbi:MAG: N-6 DNA methylase, partial [Acidobacteria bacterium]|nr:N-6 DNA methylase [Acidobacteriota bacterium]